MKPGIENHPSRKLGRFLKDKRILSKLTLREAATKLGIAASQLSELELGIGKHLDGTLRKQLLHTYAIEPVSQLNDLVAGQRAVAALRISDIYDREELLPAFQRLTPAQEEQLLGMLGFED